MHSELGTQGTPPSLQQQHDDQSEMQRGGSCIAASPMHKCRDIRTGTRQPQLELKNDQAQRSQEPVCVDGRMPRIPSHRAAIKCKELGLRDADAKAAAVPSMDRPSARRTEDLQRDAQLALEAARDLSKAAWQHREMMVLARITSLLQPPRARGNFGRLEVRRPKSTVDDSDVNFEEIAFEQAIGTGSFGAVWRGECRGDVVAIKKCKVDDKKDAEMLLMEVRYLQKLRHPRLVSFLGCCNRPPHVLMLIEYMEGGSLHGLLFGKGRKPLALVMKLRMAQQVAEGLTYLHEISIVHRDLKTMNIVLDKDLNCKICDFGLTLTLDSTHLTVRSLQGSPRYMAPEQFESTARITEKVDIWQMGCVMLELFCGKVPFAEAKGVQQVATALLVKRRPPSVPADADPQVRALVQACLRIEPKQRPASDMLERSLVITREACAS